MSIFRNFDTDQGEIKLEAVHARISSTLSPVDVHTTLMFFQEHHRVWYDGGKLHWPCRMSVYGLRIHYPAQPHFPCDARFTVGETPYWEQPLRTIPQIGRDLYQCVFDLNHEFLLTLDREAEEDPEQGSPVEGLKLEQRYSVYVPSLQHFNVTISTVPPDTPPVTVTLLTQYLRGLGPNPHLPPLESTES